MLQHNSSQNHQTRAQASTVLLKVFKEGKHFHSSLIHTLYPKLDERDSAFIQHLCFGVLRFYPRLQALLKPLLHQPLKAKDFDVQLLMLVGLYQLFYSDSPQYAVVHATVQATTALKKPWARGLVNAVLRQALRQQEKLLAMDSLAIKTNHPDWLVQLFQQAYPQDWENIVAENLKHPPLSLRVNLNKISRQNYLKELNQVDIIAHALEYTHAGITLETPVSVDKLPGFSEGWVSVQDGAAQLAAPLLELQPHMKVLDACAAPGGKTAHLLETQNTLNVLAIEKDPERFTQLKSTLTRLQSHATLVCADATRPQDWWDSNSFDRILIDAPCSATGVIRRHPDIKLHRQAQDINLLERQQMSLLDQLWPLLKVGGILVYATCSILPQENQAQIRTFLQKNPDAKEYPIIENWGHAQMHGRQLLPGQHDMDGFYYARLCKQG